MIYIIFTIAIIISIFNVLLVSNNNLIKEQKEKILIFSLMKYIYYSNMNILQISYLHFGNELENMELSAQV